MLGSLCKYGTNPRTAQYLGSCDAVWYSDLLDPYLCDPLHRAYPSCGIFCSLADIAGRNDTKLRNYIIITVITCYYYDYHDYCYCYYYYGDIFTIIIIIYHYQYDITCIYLYNIHIIYIYNHSNETVLTQILFSLPPPLHLRSASRELSSMENYFSFRGWCNLLISEFHGTSPI